jgi:hypothetical protein
MTHVPRAVAALLSLAVAAIATEAPARPVVVELFESQGCSSCPPANANLSTIADRADVIALNFAVTYWDYLGWKDTFARPAYTARQWDYARALGHGQVFTPQVVVDGVRDGVGVDPREFARLVGRAPASGGPSLALTPSVVTIGGGPRPAAPADVWLVRYDPRVVLVPIGAGENTGKTLPHRDIVRELVRLGGWSGAPEALRLPAASDPALRTAILVQAPKGGPILSAIKS